MHQHFIDKKRTETFSFSDFFKELLPSGGPQLLGGAVTVGVQYINVTFEVQ